MSKPPHTGPAPKSTAGFWSAYQPGLKWLEEPDRASVTPEAYAAIRSERYRRESHLEKVAGFGDHAGQTMVEVGCGVGTDGSRFLEGDARYLGVDLGGTTAQDLKTAFLVGGTPWRQQVALIVGVITSVIAIGWTLQFVNNSFRSKEAANYAVVLAPDAEARMRCSYRGPPQNLLTVTADRGGVG